MTTLRQHPTGSPARSGGPGSEAEVRRLRAAAERDAGRFEVVKELVDECLDLMIDYRQSGHPGGSRSKVHLLVSLMLSGAMRWDLQRPWRRFSDRFVLGAGHTVPVVYATLAVLNEALRVRFARTGSADFAFPDDGRFALTAESLVDFRHRGGLPGHAEMAGRTLFLKFNTGPSGHGLAPAAGEALALKLAGAGDVKVFLVEGEGGLTPGAAHETKNAAWGLGLSNLVFLVDWNDFGIDPRPTSSVVHGSPEEWFAPYGWRVSGTADGSSWGPVAGALLEAACGPNGDGRPSMAYFKTRKGRGYGRYDAASHGSPLPPHGEQFWENRRPFMERYGVEYEGVGRSLPADPAACRAEQQANLDVVMGVLGRDEELVTWLSDRIVALAEAVPATLPGFRLRKGSAGVLSDRRILDYERYPAELFKRPGEKAPNRAALGAWGAYVNSLARRDYGRPLFVACSADLAESTNLAGFAAGFGDQPGFGWYERDENPFGSLLPTEITEFANAGLMAGLATVGFAEDPFEDFDGFWAATSTYGSFCYLNYGPIRLFSQLAQDCELKVGRFLWVAGHSGPETAEDSRTHFGIAETGVTKLFPDGHVIDLHPFEYNEVPVMLAAGFATEVPVIALHLTRPPVEIPDRERLGIPSHLAAARGAYLMRAPRPGAARAGTIFLRGTMTTAAVLRLLPEIDRRGWNVKIVAALSPELFARQPAAYRRSVVEPGDSLDAMVITNGAFAAMREFAHGPLVREYSLSADRDDRWRTGGSVEEVMEEAGLDEGHILEALERFVAERPARRARWREAVESAGE